MLDVATPGPGRYLEPLKVVLPHTDVFVPNTDEAELILGESDPVRQALAFHEMGARRVVITRGERGVVSVSDKLRVKLGTYPISFVDGSGGGDAFNAGYIVGLLEGRSEIECLKLASAVGASCVRAVGTTAGVFTREQAEEFVGASGSSLKRSAERLRPNHRQLGRARFERPGFHRSLAAFEPAFSSASTVAAKSPVEQCQPCREP